jgi:hypothetical protein
MKKMHFWETHYLDDEGDQVLLAINKDLVATINFACVSGWKVNPQ